MSTRLSDREHARLATELIDACGTNGEASRACGLSPGQLSRYKNHTYGEFMSGRTINALEDYCKRTLYSGALLDAVGLPAAVGSLRDLACELSEGTASLQAIVRAALADGRLTPRELDDIAHAEREAEAALARLRAARLAAEKPPTN